MDVGSPGETERSSLECRDWNSTLSRISDSCVGSVTIHLLLRVGGRITFPKEDSVGCDRRSSVIRGDPTYNHIVGVPHGHRSSGNVRNLSSKDADGVREGTVSIEVSCFDLESVNLSFNKIKSGITELKALFSDNKGRSCCIIVPESVIYDWRATVKDRRLPYKTDPVSFSNGRDIG